MKPTIDSHHHFWQLSQPFNFQWLNAPANAPIKRNFLPGDLEPLIKKVGIQHTIVVQTQHDTRENRWALELAAQHEFICGVVGWVDLSSEDCERQLLEFKDHPKFVGVRHVTQDEPDDDFIIRPAVLEGLQILEKHNMPFDLLFYVKQLHHAAFLGARFPELPMVIDHLAKPRIKDRILDDWLTHFRAAAHYPNMYCKLSGMVTESDWTNWKAEDLVPYVQTALDSFGPERLMFGSDWPVSNLAASYEDVHEALVDALGPLSDSERSQIFGGTAARFYKIAF